MIYITIDESGDIGDPSNLANSKDFSLAACICDSESIEELSEEVEKLVIRLKKKEIKFSKMSPKEISIVRSFLTKLNIKHISIYSKKTHFYHGKNFLKDIFGDLVEKIDIKNTEKIKVFIDGTENAFFRKIYEPLLKRKFPHSTLKFANSIRKPLIQVADFYAGQRRRTK